MDIGDRNGGNEVMLGRYGVKERNVERQIVVDFVKRMQMVVVDRYFKIRVEYRVTREWCTQMDYILCSTGW